MNIQFVIYVLSSWFGMCQGVALEKQLRNTLFSDYNRDQRPVLSRDTPVVVQLQVFVYELLSLNEAEETTTLKIYSRLKWVDEYLKWNPDDYNGTQFIELPVANIWTPKIRMVETIEIIGGDTIRILSVMYDGTVTWARFETYKASCEINVKAYPWDEQTCKFHWSLAPEPVTKEFVQMRSDATYNATYYFKTDSEWDLLSFDTACTEMTAPDADGVIRTVTGCQSDMALRRQPGYYVITQEYKYYCTKNTRKTVYQTS